MNNLYLIGCSALAMDILENIQSSNWRICIDKDKEKNLSISDIKEIFFIDKHFESNEYLGFKVFNSIEEVNIKAKVNFFIVTFSSIKNQFKRENERLKYINNGFTEISLISKSSYLSNSSRVESGCIISQGVYVGPYTLIKNNSIILFNSVISRNSIINKNCFISANVTVTASKIISQNSYIGAGSLIDANIGESSVIGSGSIVKRSVKNFTIFDGSTNQSKRVLSFKNNDLLKKARENL